MELLLDMFLPFTLYLVTIILVIILIVVALRLIKMMDKVDKILDNVDEKINSFNGAFTVIRNAADGIASISDSFVYGVTTTLSKIFGRFNKRNNYEEDDEYEG